MIYFHIVIFQIINIRENKGKAKLKENCQMGTENFIQSEVSSPDGAKFKPETNRQVTDTVSNANYSKFGQLQADDICFLFWNKDEFNNKMLHTWAHHKY